MSRPPEQSLPERVREAAAAVAAGSLWVRPDTEAIANLAADMGPAVDEQRDAAPEYRQADDATTLAFVLTFDAVNFGSGWFPRLAKRPGLSGARTITAALHDRFHQHGPFTASELTALTPEDCTRIFEQPEPGTEVRELLGLFTRALNDLGTFIVEEHGSRFEGVVERAGGSAALLAEQLAAAMPLYRDEAQWQGRHVPLYKRAQITAADVARNLPGWPPARFDDLHALTMFADNLVPHVLRVDGALRYHPDLAARIDGEKLLPNGSEMEVEIRACAVHVVELLAGSLGAAPMDVDAALWWRGRSARYKAIPRHRTRCPYY